MKKFLNLPKKDQENLSSTYGWIIDAFNIPKPNEKITQNDNYTILSISIFDHWLTEEEANIFLCNTPKNEQENRYNKHLNFCKKLVAETEILSFKIYGKQSNKIKFRKFLSDTDLLNYLAPINYNSFGDNNFSVLLPSIQSFFIGGFDYTNHFYYQNSNYFKKIHEIAAQSGLHILT